MGKPASRGLSGDSQHRLAFKVELARGCSHIASTLTPASMSAAVAEVLGYIRICQSRKWKYDESSSNSAGVSECA
jgi:hypothetical protein